MDKMMGWKIVSKKSAHVGNGDSKCSGTTGTYTESASLVCIIFKAGLGLVSHACMQVH